MLRYTKDKTKCKNVKNNAEKKRQKLISRYQKLPKVEKSYIGKMILKKLSKVGKN